VAMNRLERETDVRRVDGAIVAKSPIRAAFT
jgi:hypothetical protein